MPRTVAYMLDHAEAKVLITDREFSADHRRRARDSAPARPAVIDIDDPAAPAATRSGRPTTRRFLAGGDPGFAWAGPADEWDAIAINYTSGTTGNPKGVVYHHRGAYLNAIGNTLEWDLPRHPTYLWTLPMFHCNGWCFPWTIAARAGTNVCLRKVTAAAIYDAIADQGVDHLCGAPIVLGLMISAPAGGGRELRPPLPDHDRRRAAAGGGAAGDGRARVRGHPRLRPDRGLWPRRRLRLAPRVGRLPDRRAGAR